MILIAGIPSESPLQMAIDAATALKIPFVIFNQRVAQHYQFCLKTENNCIKSILQVEGVDYDLERLNGAYIRTMDHFGLPELSNDIFAKIDTIAANKLRFIHEYFMQWTDSTVIRIFNAPSATLSNMSKPYQAQLITNAGFYTPNTCITNNEDEVLQFKKKQKKIIFKSISSTRSIVKELDASNETNLKKLAYLPTQFQQKLIGQNIRVHVVGDVLFATIIKSNKVDYRYAKSEGGDTVLEEIFLPKAIEKKCFNLAKQLALPFCGIDLFLTDDKQYYCFEVNPSPGYSYYEANTGQKISHALVKFLEYGTAK
jgi:glutathione synthase/RimK-type ligase-like ATP-grasp enzyme